MASIYFGLVTLVNEFGLAAAVVTRHDLTDDQIAQLNTLSVLMGLAALAVSCGVAAPLADFFGAPSLRWVVVTMSLAFVITAFQTVPAALMQRDLEFRSLALLEGCQALVMAGSMVLLAELGAGYWALVLSNVAGSAVLAALVLAKRAHRFSRPRFGELRGALSFSTDIVVGRLAWYAQTNADSLVVGRVLGQAALGAYTIGLTLASVPMDKIAAVTSKVAPGVLSAVKADAAALRRYLFMLTEALALITVPLAWGVALLADDIVLLLLGETWRGAAAPLQLLAILASLRPGASLLPQILNVTGRSGAVMVNSVLSAVVLPAGFVFGSQWGTVGIAAAWLVLYPFMVLPMYWLVLRSIEMSPGHYLSAMWPAVSASLVMVAAVEACRSFVDPAWDLPLRVSLAVAAGAGAYGVVLLTAYRERLRGISRFLQGVRSHASVVENSAP